MNTKLKKTQMDSDTAIELVDEICRLYYFSSEKSMPQDAARAFREVLKSLVLLLESKEYGCRSADYGEAQAQFVDNISRFKKSLRDKESSRYINLLNHQLYQLQWHFP